MNARALTHEQIQVLSWIGKGADVLPGRAADLLRAVEQHHPGIVRILPPRRIVPRDQEQPIFAAFLTRAGKAIVEKSTS